jgi:hypothetical protein
MAIQRGNLRDVESRPPVVSLNEETASNSLSLLSLSPGSSGIFQDHGRREGAMPLSSLPAVLPCGQSRNWGRHCSGPLVRRSERATRSASAGSTRVRGPRDCQRRRPRRQFSEFFGINSRNRLKRPISSLGPASRSSRQPYPLPKLGNFRDRRVAGVSVGCGDGA